MKSFYSILFFVTRPVLDEKISIGLFGVCDQKVFFRYSLDKLKITKDLTYSNTFNIIKSSLNSFDGYFNYKFIEDDNLLFKLKPLDHYLGAPPFSFELKGIDDPKSEFDKALSTKLNYKYFEYLNNYTNNSLQFSKPKTIDAELNEELFEILFKKFVFESKENKENKTEKKEAITHTIKSKINPKIEDRVNIDINLTSDNIKNLIVPTSVWFIGKNDTEVTGEIIDFNKRTYDLENTISKYLNLIRALKDSKGKHLKRFDPKHFLVGKEPDKSNSINHKIWKELHVLEQIDYVSTNETGKIKSYLEEHDVEPFLSK